MDSNDIKKALCRQQNVPTSLFFEEFELMDNKDKSKIISICRRCPVRRQCREDAESMAVTYGVWGGALFKSGKIVRDYVDA